MNKYFTRGLLATFVVALVFAFGSFISVTPASAQTSGGMSTCELIKLLVTLGVVTPEKASAVGAAFGCTAVPPVPPVTPPTSTSTSNFVSIIGTPTLELAYDSAGKESKLQATYDISVTAMAGDINLFQYVAAGIGFVDSNGQRYNVNSYSHNTIPPASGVVFNTDVYGQKWYTILQGNTARFRLSASVLPNQLFSGNYHAVLSNLMNCEIPSYNGQQTKCIDIVTPVNSTNNKVIVGEISPYITSATFVPGITSGFNGVKVNGVRLSSTQSASIRCDNVGVVSNKPNYSQPFSNSTAASFVVIDDLPSGNCTIQIIDPITGASNIVGFSVSTLVYPGFYMSSDKDTYSIMDIMVLTIKRADGKSETYPVDLYIQGGRDDKRILVGKNLSVGSSYVRNIKLSEFTSGEGNYIALICAAGQVCNGGVNTNSIPFTILPITSSPSIKIISPNGGETFKTGNPLTVNWYSSNISKEQKLDVIRLRSTAGKEYYIANNVLNDGQEVIDISNIPSGAYTLEIKSSVYTSAGQVTVMDASDSYFKIVPPVTPVIKPSIIITDQYGNQGLTVKVGESFTLSGTPKGLDGLQYWYGSGYPYGNYYNRAYFFDPIFDGSCSNNEASPNNAWTFSCKTMTAGVGKVYVEIYKDGQTYKSNIVTVTVVPETVVNPPVVITPIEVTPTPVTPVPATSTPTTPVIPPTVVTPVACTGFTLSDWSTCTNNTQSRSIKTVTPVGCDTSAFVLKRSCTVTTVSVPFSKSFSGGFGQIYDLGRLVNVSSISGNWVESSRVSDCKGQIFAGADTGSLRVVKDWTPVGGSFSVTNPGNIRYIKFWGYDACSSTVPSLNVTGSYTSQTTTATTNAATAMSGWDGFIKLLQILR